MSSITIERNFGPSAFFDKHATNTIKGVALVLMFIHHFFTFPSWWPEDVCYPILERISQYICSPLKICVPVFCFLTGYLYAYNENKSFGYSVKKITLLLVPYWLVFFSLAIIAGLVLNYRYTPITFFKECFALYRPTMIFCWYVFFYFFFMLLLPIIVRYMSINIVVDVLVSIIGIPFGFYLLANNIDSFSIGQIFRSLYLWVPVVLIGYIFAEYRFFDRLWSIYIRVFRNKQLRLVFSLIMIIVVPMGRYFLPGASLCWGNNGPFFISLDVIYTPLFIFLLVSLLKNNHMLNIGSVLSKVGEKSMLMWFLSCAFFGNCKSVFQPILYAPRNPFLVLVWGLLICYLFACIYGLVVKNILSAIDQIKFEIRTKTHKLQ